MAGIGASVFRSSHGESRNAVVILQNPIYKSSDLLACRLKLACRGRDTPHRADLNISGLHSHSENVLSLGPYLQCSASLFRDLHGIGAHRSEPLGRCSCLLARDRSTGRLGLGLDSRNGMTTTHRNCGFSRSVDSGTASWMSSSPQVLFMKLVSGKITELADLAHLFQSREISRDRQAEPGKPHSLDWLALCSL